MKKIVCGQKSNNKSYNCKSSKKKNSKRTENMAMILESTCNKNSRLNIVATRLYVSQEINEAIYMQLKQ